MVQNRIGGGGVAGLCRTPVATVLLSGIEVSDFSRKVGFS